MAHDDDQSFGPQYGDRFDFTLRFEHIIFTILPATVLIAAYPILLYQYTRKSIVVGRGWSLYAKLVSFSASKPCLQLLPPSRPHLDC